MTERQKLAILAWVICFWALICSFDSTDAVYMFQRIVSIVCLVLGAFYWGRND